MTCVDFLGDMKGKIALVTGASSGIGAATAVEFAKQGVKVALHGRNRERLEITSKNCQEAGLKGEETFIVTGDITIAKDNEEVVKKVLDYFGSVDYLVNNAGSYVDGGIDAHSTEDYTFMMQVHAIAPFQFIKLLKPHLIKVKGSIVNVASDVATCPDPQMLGYSVGKTALVGLTKSAALELAADGVRCNAVSPCWVKTPIMWASGAVSTAEESEQIIADQKHSIPMKHVGEPAEIARAIVFLASDSCRFINGTALAIDGCSTFASIASCGFMLQSKV